MKHNVEYNTKDKSLGYVMAITVDTTLRQILNFIGDYEKFKNLSYTYDLLELFIKNEVAYIYLNKKTGYYFFTKSLSTLPEIEDGEKIK